MPVAELVDRDKRGVWVYYRARTQALASLAMLIGSTPPEHWHPSSLGR